MKKLLILISVIVLGCTSSSTDNKEDMDSFNRTYPVARLSSSGGFGGVNIGYVYEYKASNNKTYLIVTNRQHGGVAIKELE